MSLSVCLLTAKQHGEKKKRSINSVNDIQMVTRLEADDNQTILSIETP